MVKKCVRQTKRNKNWRRKWGLFFLSFFSLVCVWFLFILYFAIHNTHTVYRHIRYYCIDFLLSHSLLTWLARDIKVRWCTVRTYVRMHVLMDVSSIRRYRRKQAEAFPSRRCWQIMAPSGVSLSGLWTEYWNINTHFYFTVNINNNSNALEWLNDEGIERIENIDREKEN